jgi:hypothetical protein
VSFVYFIQVGTEGPIKIGVAADPVARLADLQTANATELVLLATCEGGRAEEAHIHAVCRDARLRGEWFRPTSEVLAVAQNPEAALKVIVDRTAAMPEIAVHAEMCEQARVDLWAAIRVAHEHGHSLRVIAAAAELSHEQVRRIIRAREAA